MAKRALTAAAVERIKPPKSGQADHFDAGYPGLALRVSYGGSKTWVWFYRQGSRQRRLTLGRLPSMSLSGAREAWRDSRDQLALGADPKVRRAKLAEDFESVVEEWLKRDQSKNRSYSEVKRVIDRDVKPVWSGRAFASINRGDVLALLDSFADRGAPTLARRTHAHLHRMFRWAVGRGIITSNPMADLPKPGTAIRRDRVLSDAELRALWKATEGIGWPLGSAVQLLILTGARRDEIGSLRWSEVDDKKHLIELRGERTKNGEPHMIPLSTSAWAIVKALPRVGDGDFVFTTTGRTPISGWSKLKHQLDAAMADLLRKQPEPWRLHDLRRTVATNLQRLGFNLQIIEAVLGHTSGSRAGIVGVYQRHSFADEKRAALEAWGDFVEPISATQGGDKYG